MFVEIRIFINHGVKVNLEERTNQRVLIDLIYL